MASRLTERNGGIWILLLRHLGGCRGKVLESIAAFVLGILNDACLHQLAWSIRPIGIRPEDTCFENAG